jgi:DNA-binding transcriptional MerR regulator
MKRSLKLADVCKQLDLPPYVLRYWETEFPALQGSAPAGGGARSFSLDEVALLRRIKQLLYDEGYTIAGAKKKLESEPAPRADQHSTLFASHAPEAAAESSGATPTARALDSPAEQQIESLRRGVAEALKEARAILSLLDKSSR